MDYSRLRRAFLMTVVVFFAVGVTLLLLGYLRGCSSAPAKRARFQLPNKVVLPFISPDGQWGLAQDSSSGEISLYYIPESRLVTRFHAKYLIQPTMLPWASDSRRVLLLSSENADVSYCSVFDIRNLANEVHLVGNGLLQFTASFSPNGQYVVAKVGDFHSGRIGIQVWYLNSPTQSRFVDLKGDVSEFCWLSNSRLLVVSDSGASSVALIDIQRGTIQTVRIKLSGRVHIPLYSPYENKVPIIVRKEQGDVLAVLDLSRAQLQEIILLPEVNRVRGYSWRWLPCYFPILWRWIDQNLCEIILYDASRQQLGEFLRISSRTSPSVDNSKRVWIIDNGKWIQIGELD